MTTKDKQDKFLPVAPTIGQLIRRDLGKYGGYSGVNKFFYLICTIDNLINHLGYDVVIKEVNKRLEKLKKFEEESGEETIYSKIKSWENLKKTLDNLRPKLSEIEFAYSDIKDKEFRGKKETDKIINYKKLTKKVSPYQPELYFLFNLLMEMSDMQRQTIPPEFFRTPELSKYTKSPFTKKPHTTASTSMYKE